MEIQEILALIALGFALGYLYKTFFTKKGKGGCSSCDSKSPKSDV